MNLDQDFFQVSELSEDQKQTKKRKKRSSPEVEHFFSPNSRTDLRSDAHQNQIIGGDVDDDHTQFFWGDTVKLLGGIYPPRVSAPRLVKTFFLVFT